MYVLYVESRMDVVFTKQDGGNLMPMCSRSV